MRRELFSLSLLSSLLLLLGLTAVAFVLGAAGPIQYGPKAPPEGGRNRFLAAPGLTMTWLTGGGR